MASTLPDASVAATADSLTPYWQRRFDLLDQLNAAELGFSVLGRNPELRRLGLHDRMRVSFNFWAFLFGPFYYLTKGLWIKGCWLLAIGFALNATLFAIEASIGAELPTFLYWVPIAGFCAGYATLDVYLKARTHERLWRGFPSGLAHPAAALASLVGCLLLALTTATFTPTFVAETEDQLRNDISAVWRESSTGAFVRIDMTAPTPSIAVGDHARPITIESVDNVNQVVVFSTSNSTGQPATWSVQQVFDQNDRFNLLLTMPDGSQEWLYFVRRSHQ